MQYQIQKWLPLIEEAMQNLPYPGHPASLYDPIRYFMALPGKRIRPVFVLQCLELFREPGPEDARAALATELFHNFSLVHDDIMDKADMRRGFQTVHKKWDEPTALLAGDAMLVLAYQVLVSAHTADLKSLMNAFNDMALAVCEGQQLDMDFSETSHVEVAEYLGMIDRKTGALIAFSFEMAGFLAGLPQAEREKIRGFGQAMGRCFQLRDDYLDLFGTEEKTGKKRGGDIANRKLTFPVLCSLNNSENAEFLPLRNAAPFESDDRIRACLDWMETHHIPEMTLNLIQLEMDAGLRLLGELPGGAEPKKRLEELCKLLAYREK
jgi:geranylgeranyl diphosphate synthase type II